MLCDGTVFFNNLPRQIIPRYDVGSAEIRRTRHLDAELSSDPLAELLGLGEKPVVCIRQGRRRFGMGVPVCSSRNLGEDFYPFLAVLFGKPSDHERVRAEHHRHALACLARRHVEFIVSAGQPFSIK
ncbi:hypothetical protein D9M73_133230 [compost metagenome]